MNTHNPHVNYFSDWQTPPEWLEWVDEMLGHGWFDPCPVAPSFDGLNVKWHERVYCNPPGANSLRSVKPWWEKAWTHVAELETLNLIWCFFNNEAVRSMVPSPFEVRGCFVIPKKRVAFFRNGERIKSPRNWTWFWVSGYGPIRKTPEDCFILRTGE